MSFWNRILFLEAKRILNWYFHSNLQTRGLIIIFYTKYITSQKKTRTISRKYVHLPLDLQSKYRCESKFVRFNPRWWKKSNQSRLNVGKKDSLQLLYRFSVFVYSVYRSILITMCERRLLLNVRWKYTLEKRFDGQTSVKWHFISAKTHTHTFVRINYSMGDCVTALEQAYRAAVFVFACMCAVIPGLHYAL